MKQFVFALTLISASPVFAQTFNDDMSAIKFAEKVNCTAVVGDLSQVDPAADVIQLKKEIQKSDSSYSIRHTGSLKGYSFVAYIFPSSQGAYGMATIYRSGAEPVETQGSILENYDGLAVKVGNTTLLGCAVE